MFVQPDPFASAEQVNNEDTVTTLKGDLAKAAIDAVTKVKFGSMTITAAVTAEAAVSWTTAPSAKAGSKQITVSGATNAAAYVYCGVSKNPAARFRALQNATANASANATAKPATPAEPVNIRSANAAATWSL